MRILGIDPGPVKSAFALIDENRNILDFGIVDNQLQLDISEMERESEVVVEMIHNMGMPCGSEVFETCVMIGRIWSAIGRNPHRLSRVQVKIAICGSVKAKDANIRQAIIDEYGGRDAIGTKKCPGPLYGVSKDVWSALAIAITWSRKV